MIPAEKRPTIIIMSLLPFSTPEYSSIATSSVRRKLMLEAVAVASIIELRVLFWVKNMIDAIVHAPLTKSISREISTIHSRGFCSLTAS